MNIECRCGNWMSDVGSPNDTENLLISNRSIEKLQDLVDSEVQRCGMINEWPEHWENCGAVEVWKCLSCNRLYLSPKGDPTVVTVYAPEAVDRELE